VELDTPDFTLREAATAAGIKPARLRAWMSRPPFVISLGPHDQKSTKTAPARLTLRRVLCIAVTAALREVGLSLSSAGGFAFVVTDTPQAEGPPCLEWPEPPFLIYYPQTQSYKILGGNPTFHSALRRTGPPGTVAFFGVISLAVVIRRVRERLENRCAM
jgi:hypothetical protein